MRALFGKWRRQTKNTPSSDSRLSRWKRRCLDGCARLAEILVFLVAFRLTGPLPSIGAAIIYVSLTGRLPVARRGLFALLVGAIILSGQILYARLH